ncbi:SH3 domain-containing protein [Streptomyces sp. NPDC002004]
MNRRMQRGLVAAFATLAMFPVAVVSADAASAAPQRTVAAHQSTAGRYVPPPLLWRPAHRTGHVDGRTQTRWVPLNVRSGPGTGYRVIGWAHPGSTLHIRCKTNGSRIAGNRRWYRLTHHDGYVAAHYVHNFSTVPWC